MSKVKVTLTPNMVKNHPFGLISEKYMLYETSYHIEASSRTEARNSPNLDVMGQRSRSSYDLIWSKITLWAYLRKYWL